MPDNVEVFYADMDGDGDLDAVASPQVFGSVGLGQLAWSENLGAARFSGWRIMETSPSPGNVRSTWVADLDGDGDPDVLQTRSGGRLGWLENLGAGQLAAYAPIVTGPTTGYLVRAADLDGDGDSDILLASNQRVPTWFENVGSMTFAPGVAIGASASPDIISSLEPVDVDGDGQVDVTWRNTTSDATEWARNTGTGFALFQVLFIPPQGMAVDTLVDVDGDGDVDLVGANSQTNSLVWFENTGVLQLSTPQTIGLRAGYFLEVADMNNDGDVDLISAGDHWLNYNENLGGGQFGPSIGIAYLNPGSNVHTTQLLAKDVNGDGFLDPIVVNDNIRWAANLGNTSGWTFGPVADLNLLTSRFGSSISEDSQVDFDLDGDLDLLMLGPRKYAVLDYSSSILLAENSGGAKFDSVRKLIHGVMNVISVVAFDADADGDLDLAVGRGKLDEVRVGWYENVNGTFSTSSGSYHGLYSLNFSESGATVRVGDVDGDGGQDLLMTYQTIVSVNQTAAWIRSTGGGNFQVLSSWQIENPGNILLADLDGDGDDDVATIRALGGTGNSVTVYENLGSGSMGPAMALGGQPHFPDAWIEAADMDGDGELDILALDPVGNRVMQYENMGAMQFGAGQQKATTATDSSVVLGRDLDLDGDQDLVVFSENEVNWHSNMGLGGFGPPTRISQADGLLFASWATAKDMDGDLDMDLMKATAHGFTMQLNDLHFGEGYCGPAPVNSSGEGARIWAQGSPAVADNDLTLLVDQLPPGQFGFFVVGSASGFVPMPGGSQGNLCLGGAIGRMNRGLGEIFHSGMAGSAAVILDLTDVPTPFGVETMSAGTTRYFQAWFRDQNPGPTSNFTSGLSITFE